MKKALIIGLTVALIFSSCKKDQVDYAAIEQKTLNEYLQLNYPNVTADKDGLYTIEETKGTGISPLTTNYVLINYSVARIASPVSKKIFDTNIESLARENNLYSKNVHYSSKIWKIENMLKGIKLALNKMKEGGKAKFILPSNLAYEDKEIGYLPAYSTLIVELELIKVIENIDAYEKTLIEDYINKSELNYIKTEKGIYITIIKNGEGNKYKEKDLVSLSYKGEYLDGIIFDSNSNGAPLKFTIGNNNVISGFDFAVRELNLGAKARVIIPYKLGYGIEGNGSIKGYETLVFEIETNDL